jgi:GTPase SAR1 family protein
MIEVYDGHGWNVWQACRVELWDTSGDPQFSAINRAFHRGATCILLVFDLTDRASFDTIDTFMTIIRETARDDISVVLVGNKADLSQARQVNRHCNLVNLVVGYCGSGWFSCVGVREYVARGDSVCDCLQITYAAALALATRWQIRYVETSAAPTSVNVIQDNITLDDTVVIQVMVHGLFFLFLARCI